jgi:AraC-like DNA-binding protein
MRIYVKYMVSLRCKLMVISELEKLGLAFTKVELGIIELVNDITIEQRKELSSALLQSGLELMQDKSVILIERIKNIIIEQIYYTEVLPKFKFSIYISNALKYDYTYLSNLFSINEGITIEHFIILHKIERVKELILYDELNLTEIAFNMHYSSVSHLSNQFKKITGLTPSFFKQIKNQRRALLENLQVERN